MSKTEIMWLAIYVIGLIAPFIKGPLIGLMAYMFTFYTHFSWAVGVTVMGFQRFSFASAFVLMLSYLVDFGSRPIMAFRSVPQLKWLILIVVNMLFVSLFAVDPIQNEKDITEFIKVIVIYYLVANIVRERWHYRMFMWFQLWGNFFLGWQAFTRGKLTKGRLENIGAPKIKESNALANHMIMIFPYMGNLILFGQKWERLAAIGAAPFILNTIILCNSRGSYVAILAMVLAMLVLSKNKYKMKIVVGLCLAGVLASTLVDNKFWNRIGTASEIQEDGSAMGRLNSWKGAIQMIQDFPLGKGGGGWHAYSPVYIPEIVEAHGGRARSVHNTYLMMATDWGVQGLLLLMIFLGSTLLELHKMRRRVGTNNDLFYHTESTAIEVSILGYLIAAIFLNRIYPEGIYWYCALAISLSNIQKNELVKSKTRFRKRVKGDSKLASLGSADGALNPAFGKRGKHPF